jgi:hypothetical protein
VQKLRPPEENINVSDGGGTQEVGDLSEGIGIEPRASTANQERDWPPVRMTICDPGCDTRDAVGLAGKPALHGSRVGLRTYPSKGAH